MRTAPPEATMRPRGLSGSRGKEPQKQRDAGQVRRPTLTGLLSRVIRRAEDCPSHANRGGLAAISAHEEATEEATQHSGCRCCCCKETTTVIFWLKVVTPLRPSPLLTVHKESGANELRSNSINRFLPTDDLPLHLVTA